MLFLGKRQLISIGNPVRLKDHIPLSGAMHVRGTAAGNAIDKHDRAGTRHSLFGESDLVGHPECWYVDWVRTRQCLVNLVPVYTNFGLTREKLIAVECSKIFKPFESIPCNNGEFLSTFVTDIPSKFHELECSCRCQKMPPTMEF